MDQEQKGAVSHRDRSREFSAVVVLGCMFLGTTILLVAGIAKLIAKFVF